MNSTDHGLRAAAVKAERRLEVLREIEEAEKSLPFLERCFDKIAVLYNTYLFWRAKQGLLMVLSNPSRDTDPKLYLDAGKVLYDAGDYKNAKSCFDRVLETLNTDDQDIRLSALMGKLECKVAMSLLRVTDGKADLKGYEEAKYWHGVIAEDLLAASFKVQVDIKPRLARAGIQMDKLIVANIVSWETKWR